MSATREQQPPTLRLGDCVHYKGQGFGKVVKAGKFFIEILFTTGRRFQICNTEPVGHHGPVTKDVLAAIEALPSKSVARNLSDGVVIDHIEHGLGRVIDRTGESIKMRLFDGRSSIRIVLADSIGIVVDLFRYSIGQCRAAIRDAPSRNSLIKLVANPKNSSAPPPTDPKLEVTTSRARARAAASAPATRAPTSSEKEVSPATQQKKPDEKAAPHSQSSRSGPSKAVDPVEPRQSSGKVGHSYAPRQQHPSTQAQSNGMAVTKKTKVKKLRCAICKTKQQSTRNSVCADCRQDLRKGFLGLLPGRRIGPRTSIRSSLALGHPVEAGKGTRAVQGGLPSLGKKR